jgi:hypothetical protein
MMQAARYSETSVNFYQTKRRYNPEDSHLSQYSVDYGLDDWGSIPDRGRGFLL